MGGALTYANYDPVFKNRADLYVPGFARWADAAADMYIDLVDAIGVRGRQGSKEEPSSGLGVHKKNVKLGTVLEEKQLPEHLNQKKGESAVLRRKETSNSLPSLSEARDKSAGEVKEKGEEKEKVDDKTLDSVREERKDKSMEEGKNVELKMKETEIKV